MSRRKRRLIDELFGGSFFNGFEEIFDKFGEAQELGSGYSISVVQTPEGTTVRAKVGKDTDVNALKRQLQQQYPEAKIEIEGGRPLIREVETKPVDGAEEEKTD